MRQRHSKGFGLLESIIALAVGAFVVAGVFAFYRSVSGSFQAHKAATQALDLTDSIMRAYVSAPSFVGISNGRVVAEGLLPPGSDTSGPRVEPVITTAFGGRLLIDPARIDDQEGRGMTLTFTDVPARSCRGFVSRASSYGYDSISVNSQDVLDPSGRLLESVLASECGQKVESTVVLTVARDFVGGGPPSPGGPALPGGPLPTPACQVPTPATQVHTEACPMGYVGTITSSRTASCPSPAGAAQWGPWSVVRTCLPACAKAVHSPQRRTSACPPRQLGAITEERESTCPVSTGSPTWSDWMEVSNTCAPLCTAPADELDNSLPCPAGQSGLIVRRRTATCPEPAGQWHWNEWEVMSDSCG
ncbi:prepilin-type N-terminal cleavage/methylation domain-containing protein [Luteimonas sp. MC1750]|nr:prepilin-type N-terminal cleavage/methylation domain-containing protein [Luteimonas sp. MC1750]QQO07217.1 prepilin-type N-terminal cleavage/methylation domain-containing protein [Luteimonas sp. MC1750]